MDITKVTKTYDIDITLIWTQLHVILPGFVGIFTVNLYRLAGSRV